MVKTVRNLTVLGIGLGASAIVGWLLLRESKRQDADGSLIVKSQRRPIEPDTVHHIEVPLTPPDEFDAHVDTDAGDVADDLTQISDIGPRFAHALELIGVTRFAQLAAETPESLADRLVEHVTVRAQRIRDKDWIGQAARLARTS